MNGHQYSSEEEDTASKGGYGTYPTVCSRILFLPMGVLSIVLTRRGACQPIRWLVSFFVGSAPRFETVATPTAP